MGSLGDVQSALAAEVDAMRARSAAQEDDYCDTIAELQAQVLHRRLKTASALHAALVVLPFLWCEQPLCFTGAHCVSVVAHAYITAI